MDSIGFLRMRTLVGVTRHTFQPMRIPGEMCCIESAMKTKMADCQTHLWMNSVVAHLMTELAVGKSAGFDEFLLEFFGVL